MTNFTTNVFLSAVAVLFLCGCGTSVPKCSSKEAEQGLRDIIMTRFVSGRLSKKKVDDNISLKSARSISFDEGTKKYICEGDLEMGVVVHVTYESRLDDQDKPQTVLKGLSTRDMVMIHQGIMRIQAGKN